MNSTVTHIILAAYSSVGRWGALYVLILLLFFVFMVFSNVLVLIVLCNMRQLQRPMFVFLTALLVNDVSGGSFVVLFVAVQLLSDVHAVSVYLCHLQIFQIYSYVSVEFTALAVLSYDRYVAICMPLTYATHMSRGTVALLLVTMWAPPLVAVGITVILTASLRLCGGVIHRVYCDNYSIAKLACDEPTVNNWYELVAASVTVLLPLTVILVTYAHILRECFRHAAQRHKALSTCTPHLCSLFNFALGISFEVVQTRFDTSRLPPQLRAVLPIYIFVAQPLFNPLMYGFKLHEVRTACKRLLCGTKTT